MPNSGRPVAPTTKFGARFTRGRAGDRLALHRLVSDIEARLAWHRRVLRARGDSSQRAPAGQHRAQPCEARLLAARSDPRQSSPAAAGEVCPRWPECRQRRARVRLAFAAYFRRRALQPPAGSVGRRRAIASAARRRGCGSAHHTTRVRLSLPVTREVRGGLPRLLRAGTKGLRCTRPERPWTALPRPCRARGQPQPGARTVARHTVGIRRGHRRRALVDRSRAVQPAS
jgi:hypothetical protein